MAENKYESNAFEKYDVINPRPVFDKSVNIVFSTDANYLPYLSVALQSLIDNSAEKNNYDIIILSSGIVDWQKRFIVGQAKGRGNFSIRFLNIEKYIEQYGLDKLFIRTNGHISMAAYYRLFAGKIFGEYQKILYLDSDIVINADIADLATIDIKDYPIAAIEDVRIAINRIYVDDEKFHKEFSEYMREILDMTDIKGYFNSGVLIIDIPKYNEIGLDHLLDLAKKNNRFYHDQNVLNAAFQHNYYRLPLTWNCQYHIMFCCSQYKKYLSADDLSLYEEYDSRPNIIHYTSSTKPWNAYYAMAEFWWRYATKTPFFPIIIKRFTTNAIKPDIEKWQMIFLCNNIIYLRLRKIGFWLLKGLSWGERRNKYRAKYKIVRQLIRRVKEFRRDAWQKLSNDGSF